MKFNDIYLLITESGNGFLSAKDAKHYCKLANEFNNKNIYTYVKRGDYYIIVNKDSKLPLDEGFKDIALAGLLGASTMFAGDVSASNNTQTSNVTKKDFNVDTLINAIHKVESDNSSNKNINKEDKFTSLGPFQITRGMLNDINNIIKLNSFNVKPFKYNDRSDYKKCVLMLKIYFKHYLKVYNIKPSYINCARMWNGGPNAFKPQKHVKENKLKEYTSKILKVVDELE